nr:phosphatidate cytidylyltransferase [uncultured Blautia sp.]
MFKTRLLSGIVLVIIAAASIAAGGPVLFAVLLTISLIGVNELYRAMDVHQKGFGPLEVAGYAGTVLYYITLLWPKMQSYSMMAVLFALVLIMCVYVFYYPKYRAEQIMAALFGVVYVAVMLSYIFKTRNLEGGAWLVGLIFLSSWGSDTCAYCVGVLFGKHKMAPILSPKKSVEGGVGGVVGAALLGALYAVLISGVNPASGHTPLMYGIICAVGALISMVGDLAASAIKRNKEIKDYGKLIPGHGGILDRFDSVIFTAPFIYFLATVLI